MLKMNKYMINLMLLLFIISSSTAYSQTFSNKEKTMEKDNNELQILNIVRQFTQLMMEGDTKGINKLVAAGFTLTHLTGYVQPKAEWYAEIESESMKYYGCEEMKTSVKINGNKATFTGQNLLDARIWGSRNNWRLQQIMELEKRGHKWMILKSVASTF